MDQLGLFVLCIMVGTIIGFDLGCQRYNRTRSVTKAFNGIHSYMIYGFIYGLVAYLLLTTFYIGFMIICFEL